MFISAKLFRYFQRYVSIYESETKGDGCHYSQRASCTIIVMFMTLLAETNSTLVAPCHATRFLFCSNMYCSDTNPQNDNPFNETTAFKALHAEQCMQNETPGIKCVYVFTKAVPNEI